jgi:hypothetical protein
MLTPEQRRADAIEAAHEWREEQRERMPLPQRGEKFPIRWPDAEHDFAMIFAYEDRKMCGAPPGWTYLHGQVVEPESWHGRDWSFMVHLVDGEWTMLPKGGKLADVQGPDPAFVEADYESGVAGE